MRARDQIRSMAPAIIAPHEARTRCNRFFVFNLISLSKLPALLLAGMQHKSPGVADGLGVVNSIKTQSRHQSVSLYREYFDGGVTMSRRRNPFHQPTPEYNAYLAGWAFAFSVVLVTLMLIAHGVHF